MWSELPQSLSVYIPTKEPRNRKQKHWRSVSEQSVSTWATLLGRRRLLLWTINIKKKCQFCKGGNQHCASLCFSRVPQTRKYDGCFIVALENKFHCMLDKRRKSSIFSSSQPTVGVPTHPVNSSSKSKQTQHRWQLTYGGSTCIFFLSFFFPDGWCSEHV